MVGCDVLQLGADGSFSRRRGNLMTIAAYNYRDLNVPMKCFRSKKAEQVLHKSCERYRDGDPTIL